MTPSPQASQGVVLFGLNLLAGSERPWGDVSGREGSKYRDVACVDAHELPEDEIPQIGHVLEVLVPDAGVFDEGAELDVVLFGLQNAL